MASGMLNGHVDPRFEPLRDVLESHLTSGAECGLSVTVDIDGDTVVDVYGGHADEARTRPWEPDTIVNVWSTTKTVTSLAVLMLADRGLVDLDAPVAAYWPEFAANGKEQVLVRHLMSHSSGVSGWDAPFALTDMYDLERSTALLAAQAPWWEPGTASGYHALNFGHLLGEIVRRVSGKSLTEFVATEIAGPLNADFQIGASKSDWARCAEIIRRRSRSTWRPWTRTASCSRRPPARWRRRRRRTPRAGGWPRSARPTATPTPAPWRGCCPR
jgi:CubicO group peptidase (beta-lactamase class C family)